MRFGGQRQPWPCVPQGFMVGQGVQADGTGGDGCGTSVLNTCGWLLRQVLQFSFYVAQQQR